MFSFTRNLRKGLLANQRIYRYLFYAVGEFILIVAGILVAMEINDWNERKKTKIQGQEYVRQIYKDLHHDLGKLEGIVDLLEVQYDGYMAALRVVEAKPIIVTDTMALHQKIKGGPGLSVPVERKENTWDLLKSTGSSSILESDTLIQQLTEYYDHYDYLIYHFNQLPYKSRAEFREMLSTTNTSAVINEYHVNQDWTRYTHHSGQMVMEWLNNPKFERVLRVVATSSTVNIKQFNDLRQNTQSILTFMEGNLDQVLNPQ